MSEVKRKRAISMDKALNVLPKLQADLERLYRNTREAGLTQEQHLLRKREVWAWIENANLPSWARHQMVGYDRALFRQQERDTVFVYRCPETGKYYTTHGNTCPGLDVYPQEKIHQIHQVHHWVSGKVWRHSHSPFFGDICP